MTYSKYYSKYAKKNQYLEVYSGAKEAGDWGFRELWMKLSKHLWISGPLKARFVRSDYKRDNKEVYQEENGKRFEKRVKCNPKNNKSIKYTNKSTKEDRIWNKRLGIYWQ
jgi:hypothetical protein